MAVLADALAGVRVADKKPGPRRCVPRSAAGSSPDPVDARGQDGEEGPEVRSSVDVIPPANETPRW
jgi:hypothetical protein